MTTIADVQASVATAQAALAQAQLQLASLAPTPPPPSGMPAPAGYTHKIFEDDFAGTTLDAIKWVTVLGSAGNVWNNKGSLSAGYSGMNMPGGNQQAVLNASQLSVNNGLTITAKQNTTGVQQTNYPWISGIVNTMGKFTLPQTQWYVQANVKLPDSSAGCWPSMWFLPGLVNQSANEVDAYEGGFNELKGVPPNRTVHFDYFAGAGQAASEQDVQIKIPSISDMSAAYHILGIEWVPGVAGHIKWYIDNVLMETYNGLVTVQGYEIMLTLQIAASNASGYHTVPAGFTTWQMKVAEVQAWTP